jgi:hypothetical protein
MIAQKTQSTGTRSKGERSAPPTLGTQEGRMIVRRGSVEWYDSGESSHDSSLYVPPGGPLE